MRQGRANLGFLGEQVALRMQSADTDHVARMGEDLLVTNRDGSSRTFTGIPSPIGTGEAASIFGEGSLNADEDNPHLFVFDANAIVKEAASRVTYDGTIYRISRVNSRRVSGVVTQLMCLGIREGPA